MTQTASVLPLSLPFKIASAYIFILKNLPTSYLIPSLGTPFSKAELFK